MDTKVMFSSNNDLWETTQTFFDELDKEFHFDLDACATHDNHKCEKYFTEEENGLVQDWGGENSVLQPALLQKGKPGCVGQEMFRGVTETRYNLRYVDSCKN